VEALACGSTAVMDRGCIIVEHRGRDTEGAANRRLRAIRPRHEPRCEWIRSPQLQRPRCFNCDRRSPAL